VALKLLEIFLAAVLWFRHNLAVTLSITFLFKVDAMPRPKYRAFRSQQRLLKFPSSSDQCKICAAN
jgi:hypothetical protein